MSVRDVGAVGFVSPKSTQKPTPTVAEALCQSNGSAQCAVRLVEQARSGVAESQGELLERCRNYLLLVAARSTDPALRQKVSPSDLVQETFLNARRCFGQFQGSTEAELQGWLHRILENNVRQAMRTFYATTSRDLHREISIDSGTDKSGALQLPAADETPSRQLISRDQRAAVSAALARLPTLQRLVILWRKIDGKSFSEIGKLTNRSEEAARKVWIRAIEQLRLEFARGQ